MMEQIKQYMDKLVSINSVYPTNSCKEICEYIEKELTRFPLQVTLHNHAPDKYNVCATLGEGRPHLVLNSHVDTIAPGDGWESAPFTVTQEGDNLYGLGISNCKALTALHMALASKLAQDVNFTGKVTFTFVCDEEKLGQDGLASLRGEVLGPVDSLLVAAPSNNQLICRERGIMWMKLRVFGKSAHAGKPEIGDSAVLRMVRILSKVEAQYLPTLSQQDRDGLASTMNVSKLHGGENTNVVPAYCEIEIDRRFPLGISVDQAFTELEQFISSLGEPDDSWELLTLLGTEPYESKSEGKLNESLGCAIEKITGKAPQYIDAVGAFDGRYFSSDNLEIITFGSGDGAEGHADNEKISLQELEASAAIHLNAIHRYLNIEGNK
ncbi:M20 family metallopeptidase [Vibrio sp. 10N.261.51.F12]|uniref:M20 family metallopeptidase n=1 Tax=Vibrio sp. 10N.261.51.F12 TaxID=3229679 RepID=UPI003550577D